MTIVVQTQSNIVSEYDQEIPQSQTAEKPVASWGRAAQLKDKQSKATSPIFSIELIAKLEWTQSNAKQNIEQLQDPTMGVTINNRATALNRQAAKATREAMLKCILLVQNIRPIVWCCWSTKNVKLAWRLPNYCNQHQRETI